LDMVYKELLRAYGPQGWWPLLSLHGNGGGNPTKSGSVQGYHPGDYSYPRTIDQQFEICVGAILTQNTAWQNVEKALINLRDTGKLRPEAILQLPAEELALIIRPAGYFNQKAKKLKIFSEFFLGRAAPNNGMVPPSRDELLSLWGIGRETADSILLYAFKVPTFVVDAYTRRVLLPLGLIEEGCDYDQIKASIEDAVPGDLVVYQEFHALLVEHAKRQGR